MSDAIFLPFVGMMLLTLAVWLLMFQRRITAIRTLGIQIQTRADLERLPAPAINASNNFQNLFELPVIFYACVLAVHMTGLTDAWYVAGAIGFFVFRLVHSAIHCTYNHVMHRFAAYAVASLFLWIMVIRLALAALAAA